MNTGWTQVVQSILFTSPYSTLPSRGLWRTNPKAETLRDVRPATDNKVSQGPIPEKPLPVLSRRTGILVFLPFIGIEPDTVSRLYLL